MIDLKSDLMVLPTEEMWQAMRGARPGWVIDREDPNVSQLEEMAANLMGKEAALFVPTGRMAVLVALMTYCGRGNQVIAGQNSHVIWCEQWGLSYVCGAYPRPIEEHDGKLDPASVEAAITESRFSHTPVTDLLCIENTHNGAGGRVTSLELVRKLCNLAHRHGVKVFIDGARIFYAAIGQGITAGELVAPADAVMFSLIKGLGAPEGALLCGPKQDIDRAFLNLKRIGGHAVHRAGIFAAAGIVALGKMLGFLADDIRRAQEFAEGLNRIPGISVDLASVETNIVMADVAGTGLNSARFLEELLERGVRGHKYTDRIVRFTFHRDISDNDVSAALEAVRAVVRKERE